MVLDEPNDSDEIFNIKNFQFIANKDFLAEAQPIKVDFTGFGFSISSSIELGQGCSSCGSGTC